MVALYNAQQFLDDCRTIVGRYGSRRQVGLFTMESYTLDSPNATIGVTLGGVSIRWGGYDISLNIQNAATLVPTIPNNIKTKIIQLMVDMEELELT